MVKTILSLIVIIVTLVFMIKNPKIAILTGLMAGFGAVVNIIGNKVHEAIPFMTNTTFNSLVVVAGLAIFAFIARKKISEESHDKVPSNFVLLIEFFTEAVDGLVESTMGKQNMRFAPYIFCLFIFLIVSNLLGLIGMDSPTANYSVTLALALVTFTLTQYFAIRKSGLGGYFKGFFEPIPLLSPLNIMGELANPVSLSFRLFGNILSGGLIMSLIAAGFGTISAMISPVLRIYFDIFSGILQAFIFTMLTMVFIAGSLND